jgi:Bax protein
MMIKQSKLHISFLLALGVMVLSHLSVVFYKNCCESDAVSVPQQQVSHESSAKAFGFRVPQEQQIACKSVKELNALFSECGFTLAAAKSEGKIPRLLVSKLPKDMQRAKKETFIRALLPHILQANEEIMKDRNRLLALKTRLDAGGHLRSSEKRWISKLAADHRCKSTKVTTLLAHVDVIPPSLALSQAWIETGRGASSAARLKNSTFGYMRTKTQVESFKNLLDNVRAYMVNLNRHQAYKTFRNIRKDMREKGQPLDSHKLASGLLSYSIRKSAYVQDVQRMIRAQDLKNYDHITLAGQPIR